MTTGKLISLLCTILGSLIGGLFDHFARKQEIKTAVEEYMAEHEKTENEKED